MGTLKYKTRSGLSKRPETLLSRIQHAFRQLPQGDSAEPLSAPTYTLMLGVKTDAMHKYQQWLCTINPADICAYLDGSSEGLGRSYRGFILQRGDITFQKGNGTLHSREVYDAEILVSTIALRAALFMRRNTEKIYILPDNQATVMTLSTGKQTFSIRLIDLFYNLAKSLNPEFK